MEQYMDKFKGSGLGDKIIMIAAVVLFIDGFLPWYKISACFGDICASASRNGWESPGGFWSILAILLGLALGAVVAVRLFSAGTIPDVVAGFTWPKILLGGAVLIDVLVLIKLVNESSHLGFGFFLGIICAAAITVGAGLLYQGEMKGGAKAM